MLSDAVRHSTAACSRSIITTLSTITCLLVAITSCHYSVTITSCHYYVTITSLVHNTHTSYSH